MEKAPAVLEKVVEEVIHLDCRDDFGEKREVPICSEYLYVHANIEQMGVQFRDVGFHEL